MHTGMVLDEAVFNGRRGSISATEMNSSFIPQSRYFLFS